MKDAQLANLLLEAARRTTETRVEGDSARAERVERANEFAIQHLVTLEETEEASEAVATEHGNSAEAWHPGNEGSTCSQAHASLPPRFVLSARRSTPKRPLEGISDGAIRSTSNEPWLDASDVPATEMRKSPRLDSATSTAKAAAPDDATPVTAAVEPTTMVLGSVESAQAAPTVATADRAAVAAQLTSVDPPDNAVCRAGGILELAVVADAHGRAASRNEHADTGSMLPRKRSRSPSSTPSPDGVFYSDRLRARAPITEGLGAAKLDSAVGASGSKCVRRDRFEAQSSPPARKRQKASSVGKTAANANRPPKRPAVAIDSAGLVPKPKRVGKINTRCIHDRVKSICKECGGGSLCKHDRVRSKCIECGSGKAFCKHGRPKARCRECHGSDYCTHGKCKFVCSECGGSQLCAHGIKKSSCRFCGSGYCHHGRERSVCKPCGGSQICAHGRRRCVCKECGGSQICPHNKRKSDCRDCKLAKQAKGATAATARKAICPGDALSAAQRRA